MRIKRPCLIRAVVLAAIFFTAVAARTQVKSSQSTPTSSGRWIRVDSEHFTFFSNCEQDVVLTIAYDLEGMRHVLSQLWPGADLDSPVPSLLESPPART